MTIFANIWGKNLDTEELDSWELWEEIEGLLGQAKLVADSLDDDALKVHVDAALTRLEEWSIEQGFQGDGDMTPEELESGRDYEETEEEWADRREIEAGTAPTTEESEEDYAARLDAEEEPDIDTADLEIVALMEEDEDPEDLREYTDEEIRNIDLGLPPTFGL